MMCEASENEVEVNHHSSIKNDSNTEDPVSNEKSVSHNEKTPNEVDESSTVPNKTDVPIKENTPENKTSNNDDDSGSHSIPSNERNISDNDDNVSNGNNGHYVQADNDSKFNEPQTENNQSHYGQDSDGPKHEWNGHTNGSCANEGNNKDIVGNHDASGKSLHCVVFVNKQYPSYAKYNMIETTQICWKFL